MRKNLKESLLIFLNKCKNFYRPHFIVLVSPIISFSQEQFSNFFMRQFNAEFHLECGYLREPEMRDTKILTLFMCSFSRKLLVDPFMTPVKCLMSTF